MKMVLATRNAHKIREMTQILSKFGIEAIPQQALGYDLDVEETGTTFSENAYLKAKAVMDATGLPAVADDSGLEVDALNGEPGIYSARYGGDHEASDAFRNELLLKNMAGVPDGQRTARYVAAICLCFPDGRRIDTLGTCEGEILREGVGEGGFGYDPLFWCPEEGVSFAQLAPERKNEISHRAFALAALEKELEGLLHAEQ